MIVRTHPYKPRVGHPQVHLWSGTGEIQEHSQEWLCHTNISIKSMRLFDGADGEAGDEAVEKEVVEEGYGEAGDQTGGH